MPDLDQLVADLADLSPVAREGVLLTAGLTDVEMAEVRGLLRVADDLWLAAHGAPPLEADPTARMLGLVE